MDGAKSFEGRRRSLDAKGGSRRRIKKNVITARVSTKAEEEGRKGVFRCVCVVCYKNKVYGDVLCV